MQCIKQLVVNTCLYCLFKSKLKVNLKSGKSLVCTNVKSSHFRQNKLTFKFFAKDEHFILSILLSKTKFD